MNTKQCKLASHNDHLQLSKGFSTHSEIDLTDDPNDFDLDTEEGKVMLSNQIWKRIDCIVAESLDKFSDDLADLYEKKQAVAIGSLSTDVDYDFTKRGRFFNPESYSALQKDSRDVFRKENKAASVQSPVNDFHALEIKGSEDSSDEEDFPMSILDQYDSQADLDASHDLIERNKKEPKRVIKTKVSLSRSILISNIDEEQTENDRLLSDEKVNAVFPSGMDNRRRESIDPVASALGALDLFATF